MEGEIESNMRASIDHMSYHVTSFDELSIEREHEQVPLFKSQDRKGGKLSNTLLEAEGTQKTK